MLNPRPRVLMVAFACNPAGGGEHWLGWGWAEQAAQFCDVTLLTWDRFREPIEEHARKLGIRAVCLGVPDWVNRLGDSHTSGRWIRQLIWHSGATGVAARLHAETPFELVHQTTFHSFRIPLLPATWNVPKVWGPIAGGETCPPGFGPWLGGLRMVESMRHVLNFLTLAQPRVRRSLRAADVIFVSNQTTLRFLPQRSRGKCLLVPPNAVRGNLASPPERITDAKSPLKLLFVGNCVATRAMPLVFEAMKKLPADCCELTVVGAGAALNEWKSAAANAGLERRVVFTGALPYAQVAGYYAKADAFVFPALRDSGGSGILEAMSAALPVICCDWGGPAEMVDEYSSFRVSVKNPEATIAGFASAFEQLKANPELRLKLGRAAFEKARVEFSWANKRSILEKTYFKLLGRRR